MTCKHDPNWLFPAPAGGIVCRKCGKTFSGLTGLKAELDADRAGEPPKPEPQEAEKPKRTRKKKTE